MVKIGRNWNWISRGCRRVAAGFAVLAMLASPVIAATGEHDKALPQEVSDKAQRLVLLVGVTTLLLAFMFVGVVLIRALRHVRQQALRTSPTPTDVSDVWAMHRLPEGAVEPFDDGNSDSDTQAQ